MGCDPDILKQLLVESGLKYTQTSLSYVFTCPRCQSKKKLYIRKHDGRFACWKCKETEGYQGRPEFALADLLGQTVRYVVARLYGGDHIQVDIYLDVKAHDFWSDDDDVDEEESDTPLQAVEWPHNYYEIDDPFSARGVAYLAGRGIDLPLAKEYGLRYCPEEQRVAFPVANHGQLYGWQARMIKPHVWYDEFGEKREMIKIQSSKGIPRDRTLMFADNLTGSKHALVGEGPVDAMKAHLCGGNVSPMGKAVGPAQVQLMLRAGIESMYLGLDEDAANETMRLIRNNFDDVKLYRLVARIKGAKEKPDLGAMDPRDVYELFLGAERVLAGQVFVFLNPSVIG